MPPRVVNIKLLCILLAVLTLVVVLIRQVHGIQVARFSLQLINDAAQAEAAGNSTLALDLLKRFLYFEPGDTEALAQYARLLDVPEMASADRVRLVRTLERLLTLQPDRAEERRRLVTVLMDQRNDVAALPHINALINAAPQDGALLMLRGQCLEARNDPAEAAKAYREAIEKVPGQMEAYVRLAALLRGPLQEPEEAQTVLDRMVELNGGQARAWLERARVEADDDRLDQAEADLAAARKLEPTNAEVLLASARLAQWRGQANQARDFWQQGLKAHPDSAPFYLGLANLESGQNHPAEALRIVWKGLQCDRLNGDPDLLLALIEAQLMNGDLKGAEETLKRLRTFANRSSLTEYLEARLLMHGRHWAEALPWLNRATARAGPVLAAVIHVAMAQCYEHLGETDRQLVEYEKAVQLDGQSSSARLGLALTCTTIFRTDRAMDLYQALASSRQPPDTLWVPFARALIRHNLALSADQRDWTEVDKQLARGASIASQAAEIAVVRAESLMAQDKPIEAAGVLQQAREALKDRPIAEQALLWIASIRVQAHLGHVAEARKFLTEAPKDLANRPELLREAVELAAAEGSKSDAVLAEVEKKLSDLAPAEQAELLQSLAVRALGAGNQGDAERLLRRALAQPVEILQRIGLLDLALQVGNMKLIEAVVSELRGQEGADGTWWRYGQAALQMALSAKDPQARNEAVRLLAEIRQRRPSWSRAALLGAQLAELQGDERAALDGYQKAFELGERHPEQVKQLVQLLEAKARPGDAEVVLRRYQEGGGELQGDLLRLAAETALRARNPDRAVVLARRLVLPGNRDYRAYLWLGQFLLAADRPGEAEGPLRQALALLAWFEITDQSLADLGSAGVPESALSKLRSSKDKRFEREAFLAALNAVLDSGERDRYENLVLSYTTHYDQTEPWLALVTALMRKRQTEEAEQAIQDMTRSLTGSNRDLALAGCWELLGRVEQAHRYYQKALENQPSDETLLRRAIEFYLRMDKPVQAQLLLYRLLDPSSPVDELRRWSRRQLALILAFGGGESAYRQAQALLELNRKEGEDNLSERRARALVRGTQAGLRSDALRELGELLKRGMPSLDEQYRLVQLYELASDVTAARKQMLDLLYRDPGNPVYLAHHIEQLLKNGVRDEEGLWKDEIVKWLDDLARVEPNSERVKRFRAELAKDK